MIELTNLIQGLKEILNADNVEQLKDALYQAVMDHNENVFDRYIKLVDNDLSTDYMQKIFEYYMADRTVKMQDYTPKSIAKLMAMLANGNDITDYCCGSGALTIQKWCIDHGCKFTLYELDDNVIPFLLFNMAVRNIECEVIQKDIITEQIFNTFEIKKSDKYAKVTKNENCNI